MEFIIVFINKQTRRGINPRVVLPIDEWTPSGPNSHTCSISSMIKLGADAESDFPELASIIPVSLALSWLRRLQETNESLLLQVCFVWCMCDPGVN